MVGTWLVPAPCTRVVPVLTLIVPMCASRTMVQRAMWRIAIVHCPIETQTHQHGKPNKRPSQSYFPSKPPCCPPWIHHGAPAHSPQCTPRHAHQSFPLALPMHPHASSWTLIHTHASYRVTDPVLRYRRWVKVGVGNVQQPAYMQLKVCAQSAQPPNANSLADILVNLLSAWAKLTSAAH